MLFRGRTVLAIGLIALFVGGVTTMIMTRPMDLQGVFNKNSILPANVSVTSPTSGLAEEEISKMSAILKLLDERYYQEVSREELTDGALDGLVSALGDPYSEYMTKKEMDTFFSEHINSTFSGIGAEVTLKDGNVVIVSPIRNSPAERAGLLAGDIILSVNGESLQGLTLSEAVEKIRGPKGTQAKLRIQRANSEESLDIIVVRDDINVETVVSEMLESDLGFIRINQFAVNTAERFNTELQKLEAANMQGLIIDVRNNPGGVVDAVQAIAESFVPEGKTIMHMEYRSGKREKTISAQQGKTYPVVVLINEGSASASEILAAAIQESANGILIGKKTFGKGLVQTTVRLNDGSGVKLTIAKWLTPYGEMIHETGISPDFEVEQTKLFETVAIAKDQDIQLDMVGDEVKNIQLILEGLGFNPGRTDGYFDLQTREAVIAFQKEYAMDASGIINVETAMKLEELVIQKFLDPANDTQLKYAIQHLLAHRKAGL